MERKECIVLILQYYEEEEQWIGDCESLGVMPQGDTIDEARRIAGAAYFLNFERVGSSWDTREAVCGKGNCHKYRRIAKSRPNLADACTQPFVGITFAANGGPVKCPRFLLSKEDNWAVCWRRMVGRIEVNFNMGSNCSRWYREIIGLLSHQPNPIRSLRLYWIES